MSLQHCQVCHQECRPLRCTRCRKAFYCSVKCQKVDWKAGHRRTCAGRPEEKVDHALQELHSIAKGLSLDQAKEHFHKVTDSVESQMEEKKRKQNGSSKAKANAKVQDRKIDVKPISKTTTKPFNFNQGFLKTSFTPKDLSVADHISFVAEDMKHISCFQITLRKKENHAPRKIQKIPEDLELSTNRTDGSHTLVTLKEKKDEVTIFAAELPRHMVAAQCSWKIEDESTIRLRLQYEEDPCGIDIGRSECHPAEVINELQCRYCQQPLLQKKPILRVCQLPAGHWEEIADYLICYDGQPVVDFSASAASAEQSVAMQDSNVVCLHQKDLGVSACVLAVTGYGEVEETDENEKGIDFLKDAAATVRGDRSWRDAAGGATVCCSQCCSPLGFASIDFPECYRLLKHRLSVGSDRMNDSNRLSSCASFLAREMVRYAEAKAIFTFVVAVESPPKLSSHKKCLLLRLVSWDTNMATSFENASRRLCLKRVAKVVFQETNDKLASNESDDVTKWEWGGVDLCCTPLNGVLNISSNETENNAIGKISTVRLLLQQDEYDEVVQSLREGGNLFSRAVTEATILVKMGIGSSKIGDGLGLTAIPLDS